MIERYKELLEEYMTAVPRNEIEESINRVLNLLSNTENVDKKVLEDIYAVTLKALSDGSNEVSNCKHSSNSTTIRNYGSLQN